MGRWRVVARDACTQARRAARAVHARARTARALVAGALVVAEVGQRADSEEMVTRVVHDALGAELDQRLQEDEALQARSEGGGGSVRAAGAGNGRGSDALLAPNRRASLTAPPTLVAPRDGPTAARA